MRNDSIIGNAIYVKYDIPDMILKKILEKSIVAFDIETSGLNWENDRIATCQIYTPPDIVIVVRITKRVPKNINCILNNKNISKVFHHAMFDLRFMCHRWHTEPKKILCTKISAKILDKDNKYKNSLKDLLERYLNVIIDKEQRTSNWLKNLSTKQREYAIRDVIYLPRLYRVLKKKLVEDGLYDLADEAFSHIPARVKLDILGYNDIYTY